MNILKYIIKSTITALAVICFFTSCQDNLKELQKMQISSNEPIGEAKNMFLKHTDSSRLKMTLRGETMMDYSNDTFPYTIFPDGIYVEIFNDNDTLSKTTIIANAAYIYDRTDIIDLQGDVVVITSEGNKFMGDQMYWNQKDKWIFTNEKFKTLLKNDKTSETVGETTGVRFDSDQQLENVLVGQPDDIFINKQDQ
jgi:LPS export ABC transporter protein LptC